MFLSLTHTPIVLCYYCNIEMAAAGCALHITLPQK